MDAVLLKDAIDNKKTTPHEKPKKQPPVPDDDDLCDVSGHNTDNMDQDEVPTKEDPKATPKKSHPPKRSNVSSPYLYGSAEEALHKAYLAKYPEPSHEFYDTEAHVAETIAYYNRNRLNGHTIPSEWTLIRAASDDAAAVEQRKVIVADPEKMHGTKRVKPQTNEEYVASYQGLRWTHFSEYRDEKGYHRWVLSVKQFTNLETTDMKTRMKENPKLELFVEFTTTQLEKIGEFTSRIFNWPSAEHFANFRGLLPHLLIYHRIKTSASKQAKAGTKTTAPGTTSSLVAAADAASKTFIPGETIELFDQKNAETLWVDIEAALKNQKNLIGDIDDVLKNLSVAGPTKPDTAFDMIFNTIYNEGGENTEKRRRIIGQQVAILAATEDTDEKVKQVIDMLNPNGKWKEEVKKLGATKYIADLLKTPFGRLVIVPSYSVGEASGNLFTQRIRGAYTKNRDSLTAQEIVLKQLSAQFDAFKHNTFAVQTHLNERLQKSDADNKERVERISELNKALHSHKELLAESRAEKEQLEKKQKKNKRTESEDDSGDEKKSPKKKKIKKDEPQKKKSKQKNSSDEESSENDEDDKHKHQANNKKHSKSKKESDNASDASDNEESEKKKAKKNHQPKKPDNPVTPVVSKPSTPKTPTKFDEVEEFN